MEVMMLMFVLIARYVVIITFSVLNSVNLLLGKPLANLFGISTIH